MSQQELSREVQEIWALFRETSNQIREVALLKKEQPYTIFIENLRHPSYRFRHPVPVLIERNDDTVIATYHDLDMQGTGKDVSEALDDLCAGIIQYYEALKDEIPIEGEQSRVNGVDPSEGRISSQRYAHLKRIVEAKAETNPWIKYAGMFADDPDFEEVLKDIEAHRKELDEAYSKELTQETGSHE